MYTYASATHVGVWSMAVLLGKPFEYYCYKQQPLVNFQTNYSNGAVEIRLDLTAFCLWPAVHYRLYTGVEM